jgi:hypothetical protein
LDLFRYVKPNRRHIVDINETIASVLKKGDNFSAMSTLALRAAALFSQEHVLYISAQVALEQATRAGKIDEHLVTLLDTALLITTP